MVELDRARAWLRAHPLVADTIVAAVVFIPAVTVPADAPRGIASATVASSLLVVLGCLALILRRRYPIVVWGSTLALAVVGIAIQNGPAGSIFPALVALYTVATLTSPRLGVSAAVATTVVLIGALQFAASDSWQGASSYVVLAWSGLATAAGIAVKNQRAIVAAAVERAEQAEQSREEEALRRVEQERLRIARELHDVVAHHISIINVQSGVALHLIDSQPDKARESIGHVRDSSQDVMREMSTLLGLLRTTDDGAQTQPAPSLVQLDELIESMRRTGLVVTLSEQGRAYQLPPLVDLTAFRTVQESLTNAHKHGVGTAEVRLRCARSSITIEVENPIVPGVTKSETPGHGLVGMQERVFAVGGSIEAGPTARGVFVVRVEIPTQEPDVPLDAPEVTP